MIVIVGLFFCDKSSRGPKNKGGTNKGLVNWNALFNQILVLLANEIAFCRMIRPTLEPLLGELPTESEGLSLP